MRSTPGRSWSGRETCPSSRGACSAPIRGTAPFTTRSIPGKTTGGSSAGNAAALAAGLVDLGIGTDTGCSIRLPSAACGTVGLKPRWGSLPLDGIFPLCPSLDTVGPMGRTVEDVALLWSVLSGCPVPAPRLDGLTVGLLRQAPYLADGRETESSDAAESWVTELERLGARVVEAGDPGCRRTTCGRCFSHEAAWSHRATFPSRADEYADTVRPKLEAALRVTPDAVATARGARRGRGAGTSPTSTSTSARASRSIFRPRTSYEPEWLAALVVPPLGQPDRLGRSRRREHAVRRTTRRDRAGRRARLGERLGWCACACGHPTTITTT